MISANLRTKLLDFGGFDSSRILILRGDNSCAHGEFPGNFESTNLSWDNLSREIGRMCVCMCVGKAHLLRGVALHGDAKCCRSICRGMSRHSGGSHLSNTTCLTQTFFNRGE